jgi:hypothetical protein
MVHLSCSLPRSPMLWVSRFGTQSLCWSLRRSATPHFCPLSRSTVSTYGACLRLAHRQLCMVTLSGARRFWPWAALVLGRFITWPLRSAASILSDGRSHPLSIHAISGILVFLALWHSAFPALLQCSAMVPVDHSQCLLRFLLLPAPCSLPPAPFLLLFLPKQPALVLVRSALGIFLNPSRGAWCFLVYFILCLFFIVSPIIVRHFSGGMVLVLMVSVNTLR